MSNFSLAILGVGLPLSFALLVFAWRILRTDKSLWRELHFRTGSVRNAWNGEVRSITGTGPDPLASHGKTYNTRLKRFEYGAQVSNEAIDRIA